MKRRQILQYLAALTPGAALFDAAAQEAAYPVKPIRLIVASAPGALLDTASRLYADRMSVSLKQQLVVENIAGAGSMLAARQLVRAAPDGYTVMAAANTIVTIPHIVKNPGFATKDLTPVGEMARSPSLLVVPGASEFRSLADLVAAAKKGPGRVDYASGGVGTTSHLPVEMFARQAGIVLSHIPYKGVAPAVPDLVSGRVGFMMSTPTSVEELMKTGALRALAITSDTRSPKYPDVPTFKELGYPGATFDIWVGLLAPAGLPNAIKAKLAEAMELARADQTLARHLAATGQVISDVRTPDQFAKLLRDEEQRYRQLVKDANITAG